LLRNLNAGEIAEQALHALARSRVPLPMLRNCVFMGMGEPLNNYAAVVSAVKLLTAAPRRGGFGVARSRVTVSTVGIVPRMRTLAADAPGVRLALSLHAPSQAEREQLVPSATTFSLPALLEAAAAHAAAPGGAPPLIEYVLLRGVNDSAQHAAALGALLAGRQGWAVNLIPFNRVAGAPYDAPAAADVVAFQATLRTAFGINATVRRAMGQVRPAHRRRLGIRGAVLPTSDALCRAQDIAGACGQLAAEDLPAAAAGAAAAADIEDLPAQVALMAC
jgi:adenine C2-methylase RlmN of 23S rRNA A2503 and tRNA A37